MIKYILILQAKYSFIMSKIQDIKEYAEISERFFKKSWLNVKNQIENINSKLSEEEQQNYYENLSIEHHNFSEVFPRYLRYSLLINTCSFLEYNLVDLCNLYQRYKKIKLKYSDLKKEGLAIYQKYLKSVVEIEFPDTTNAWENLVNIYRIRNIIVHNNGEIYDENRCTKVSKFIEKNKSIIQIIDNEIIISKDFTITNIVNLFDDLSKI